MKKTMALAILLVLLVCTASFAAAETNVSFEGKAEKFVFLPDGDLFGNFKDLMPGDTVTQEIEVKNNSNSSVRIYLRAEPVEYADREFLSQLHMTVESSEKLSDTAADRQGGLGKKRSLGVFAKGGAAHLKVTLTIPVDMDSHFMNAAGKIPWIFTAEEVPEGDGPKTGDTFSIVLWSVIALLLTAAIAALLVLRARQQKK